MCWIIFLAIGLGLLVGYMAVQDIKCNEALQPLVLKMQVCIYICIYIHTYSYACAYACKALPVVLKMQGYIYIYIHTYIHTYIHVYMYTCTHTYIHTHTKHIGHTRTHMNTHTHPPHSTSDDCEVNAKLTGIATVPFPLTGSEFVFLFTAFTLSSSPAALVLRPDKEFHSATERHGQYRGQGCK